MRANPLPKRSRGRRGFTLVEILVTLGIIILLVSILIPVVSKARRTAAYTRTKRDLETIRVALDEYKNVWNMYPQITAFPKTFNTSAADNINNQDGLPIVADNGAHALYTALMLKGQKRVTRTGPPANVIVGGTTPYGPYLNTEQVKVASDPDFASKYPQIPSTTNLFLCDANGRPILYVPASQVPLSYTKTSAIPTPPHSFLASSITSAKIPYYDFEAVPAKVPDPNNPSATVVPFHNASYSSTPAGMSEMQFIMGDTDKDGIIDTTKTPPEQPAYTGPYLLWSAGADGNFGINPATGKTDDVTNFEIPVSIREN